MAFENAKENISLNNEPQIDVKLGGAEQLGSQKFDVILANINRNILLQDIGTYAHSLHKSGLLFVSGFYVEDMPMLIGMATNCGLEYVSHDSIDNWCCIKFCKNQK